VGVSPRRRYALAVPRKDAARCKRRRCGRPLRRRQGHGAAGGSARSMRSWRHRWIRAPEACGCTAVDLPYPNSPTEVDLPYPHSPTAVNLPFALVGLRQRRRGLQRPNGGGERGGVGAERWVKRGNGARARLYPI